MVHLGRLKKFLFSILNNPDSIIPIAADDEEINKFKELIVNNL